MELPERQGQRAMSEYSTEDLEAEVRGRKDALFLSEIALLEIGLNHIQQALVNGGFIERLLVFGWMNRLDFEAWRVQLNTFHINLLSEIEELKTDYERLWG